MGIKLDRFGAGGLAVLLEYGSRKQPYVQSPNWIPYYILPWPCRDELHASISAEFQYRKTEDIVLATIVFFAFKFFFFPPLSPSTFDLPSSRAI